MGFEEKDGRGSDGVWRQGREGLFGQKITNSGEVVDPSDPESILLAKEEEEAEMAKGLGIDVKEWRRRGGRLDKAA